MKTLTNWLKNNPSFALLTLACLLIGVPVASAARRQATTTTTLGGTQEFTLATPALVPFVVEIPGGIANSAGIGSANPEIIIDSDGDDEYFIVNSVMIKSNIPLTGFVAMKTNTLTINGTLFDTRTDNLMGHIGTGVQESADVLGTPILVDASNGLYGGTVPSEVIAENAGISNVKVRFFARSDDTDMTISTVRVTGWKRPSDTITVSYIPGN